MVLMQRKTRFWAASRSRLGNVAFFALILPCMVNFVSADEKLLAGIVERRNTTSKTKVLRCGNNGWNSPIFRHRRYVVHHRKWHIQTLTYRVDNFYPGIEEEEQRKIIRRAFTIWSDQTSLIFVEKKTGPANIILKYATGNHGDFQPFDGSGNIIAHAFYPPDGDIHLDADEHFSTDHKKGLNLLFVLVHEIGHSLGLRHSKNPNAIMAPSYRSVVEVNLHEDDIKGIRSLYGGTSHTSPSVTKTPTTARSPIATRSPNAAKSSTAARLPTAAKSSTATTLPTAAKSSTATKLPTATKYSTATKLPTAAEYSTVYRLPTAAKSSTVTGSPTVAWTATTFGSSAATSVQGTAPASKETSSIKSAASVTNIAARTTLAMTATKTNATVTSSPLIRTLTAKPTPTVTRPAKQLSPGRASPFANSATPLSTSIVNTISQAIGLHQPKKKLDISLSRQKPSTQESEHTYASRQSESEAATKPTL